MSTPSPIYVLVPSRPPASGWNVFRLERTAWSMLPAGQALSTTDFEPPQVDVLPAIAALPRFELGGEVSGTAHAGPTTPNPLTLALSRLFDRPDLTDAQRLALAVLDGDERVAWLLSDLVKETGEPGPEPAPPLYDAECEGRPIRLHLVRHEEALDTSNFETGLVESIPYLIRSTKGRIVFGQPAEWVPGTYFAVKGPTCEGRLLLISPSGEVRSDGRFRLGPAISIMSSGCASIDLPAP